MSEQLDKKSILEMSMGAILERVDYEMGKVIDNILDPNTKSWTRTPSPQGNARSPFPWNLSPARTGGPLRCRPQQSRRWSPLTP